MAWKDGKRVGFGSKEYVGSTRWIRLAQPGYFLYSEPDADASRMSRASRRLRASAWRRRTWRS